MIVVVAGVLRDDGGRILLTERLPGKHLAGTWEFPGGKSEPDEAPHQALVRELQEELGVAIKDSRPLLSLTHAYPEKTVRLLIREVSGWTGAPHGREGQALKWVEPQRMGELPMPAADRPMIKALGLDPRYAISPDPAGFPSLERFVDRWHQCLEGGYRFLQLRAHSLNAELLESLAMKCGRLARQYGAVWLLNGPPALARTVEADGVHLTAAALMHSNKRSIPESMILAASCHDARELAQAGRIGADLVCLSPVRPTPSHTRVEPLGWAGLANLCAVSPLPVLALGGMRPSDLDRARSHGAFGVAGISGFGS
jgi:8-oxo-dGTP diphosphatase